MITIDRISELRITLDAARRQGKTVGFVPTMGAFHAGHRSLMHAARTSHDFVVVSLFVNPLQFGVSEDLDRYPRDLEGDQGVAIAEAVDVLFAPSTAEMYPEQTITAVHVAALTDGLCGRSRPGHFDGVATVVTKLFSIVGPCTAYFGKKDFQQLAVIRRMCSDLNLPATVVGCPIVRERDGLAMSSRNEHLSVDEREVALTLYRALASAAEALASGERHAYAIQHLVVASLASDPGIQAEYVEVVRSDDLQTVEEIEGEVLVALAARVGNTRLIDNMTVRVDAGSAAVDLGVMIESEAPCAAR